MRNLFQAGAIPINLRHGGHTAFSSKSKKLKFDKFIDALGYLEGAYSLVALTNEKLIGAKRSLEIEPWFLNR